MSDTVSAAGGRKKRKESKSSKNETFASLMASKSFSSAFDCPYINPEVWLQEILKKTDFGSF